MKLTWAGRGILSAVLLAAAIVTTTLPALAKGPSQAVIEGPGLSSPIALRPPGQPTIGPDLATLVEDSGVMDFSAPDSLPDRRPPGTLGPRYTVTYTLPGPSGRSTVVQYIYPYASAGVVTYLPPGQPFWTTERTGGGWHVAGSELKDRLLEIGLPKSPPGSSRERADAGRVNTETPSLIWIPVAIIVITFGPLTLIGWRAKRRGAVRKTSPVSPARL